MYFKAILWATKLNCYSHANAGAPADVACGKCRASANYPSNYWPGMFSNDLVEGTVHFAKDVASCCLKCMETEYCYAYAYTNHANWCWLKGTRTFAGQLQVNGTQLNSPITATFGRHRHMEVVIVDVCATQTPRMHRSQPPRSDVCTLPSQQPRMAIQLCCSASTRVGQTYDGV